MIIFVETPMELYIILELMKKFIKVADTGQSMYFLSHSNEPTVIEIKISFKKYQDM